MRADVDRGLVTVEGTSLQVVIEDGAVDGPATEALRAEMTGARSDIPLFNRGGSVEVA